MPEDTIHTGNTAEGPGEMMKNEEQEDKTTQHQEASFDAGRCIYLPVFFRFDEQEVLLGDIKKKETRIGEYVGRTGTVIAGNMNIGDGKLVKKKDVLRIKGKMHPEKLKLHAFDESTVHLTCVLDTLMMPARVLDELRHESIIELKNTFGDDPVSLLINGYKTATGELCSVGDYSGVRIIEFVDPVKEKENMTLSRPREEPLIQFSIIAGKKEMLVRDLYSFGEGTII